MNLFEELDTLDPLSTPVPPRIETPTPHKIAVLILFKQYVADKKSSMDTGVTMRPQSRRLFCMLTLKLLHETDMPYNELHDLLTSPRYKLDVLLLEAFEKAMSEFCAAGVEALLDFSEVQNIDEMVNEEYGFSHYSMAGLYVRRVAVTLDRFSFTEMMSMYRCICDYYEQGIRILASGARKPVAGGVLHKDDTPPTPSAVTVNAANGDKKTGAIKKDEAKSDTAFKLPAPRRIMDVAVIKERDQYSKWAPNQAKFFVNQQMDLLDFNERNAMSPIALQRKVQEMIQDIPLATSPYFLGYTNQLRIHDYFNALTALHRALDRSPVRMMSQEKGYQYFCFNLAVMHSAFGHKSEALAALRESIMLAQENGDKRSLNVANTWMSVLRGEEPITDIERSIAEVTDGDQSLLHNYIMALHYTVKFGLISGCQPLRLFDYLQRSDELANSHNFKDYATEALALRSAVWCTYGRHELSALYAQMLLESRDRNGSESGHIGSALASTALWLQLQGEPQLSRVLLQRARLHLPRMPQAQSWMTSQCHVLIQSGIYRCRWHDALKACDQLYLMDKNDSMFQRASVYVAKREFFNARRLLDKLAKERKLSFLLRMRVQVLLAHCSLADNRFSSETVTLLLRVSEEMTAAHLDYEAALVDILLAQVLLLMGMPQKAFQAIKHCMNNIHINGGLYERAKTDFVFVRCLLAIAGTDLAKRKTQLNKSLDILERAAQSFKKISAHAKVLDVYVYLAQRFNELGDRTLRNKYAGEFRRYYVDHPIPREYLAIAY